MRQLNLPGLPGTDAADALGLAIMHAQVSKTTAALNRVTTTQARKSAAFKDGRHY
jgi:crossover junction endodeoxyribonuclease RuvC